MRSATAPQRLVRNPGERLLQLLGLGPEGQGGGHTSLPAHCEHEGL